MVTAAALELLPVAVCTVVPVVPVVTQATAALAVGGTVVRLLAPDQLDPEVVVVAVALVTTL